MKKFFVIFAVIIISIICYFLYTELFCLNITVKFDNLEPYEKKMNVYYKGFKIGSTVKIYPDKNYTNTYLKIRIKHRNINLPSNIVAVLKYTAAKGYVNILYPDSPSLKKIKNGITINGKVSKDIKSMFNDSLSDDNIDEILNDAEGLINSANKAAQNLNSIFANINSIIENINDDILSAANNLSKTTSNLENVSANINNALDREVTYNSVKNIEQTTENIKELTKNLNEITVQIEQETMPIVNSVLCETNSAIENTEEITSGIKNTLKKRMGLMRLMIGKPIKEKSN